jgi:hypothetical protein
MNRLQAQDRYDRDPLFRSVVQILVAAIDRLELTPTEVREAAIFACLRHDLLHGYDRIFLSRGPVPVSEADAARKRLWEFERWLDQSDPRPLEQRPKRGDHG